MSEDTTTPETASPDPATWDPAAWLAGASGTVRSITVYGRGDLVAVMDDLERQSRIARDIPDEDRALGDPTPDSLWNQREDVARQWEASALTLRIEGRTEAARRAIDKRLKKAGVENDADGERTLAYLADAIIEPAGITIDWLRGFWAKSESQYQQIVTTYATACQVPPTVTLPFSGAGSGNRARRTSSSS